MKKYIHFIICCVWMMLIIVCNPSKKNNPPGITSSYLNHSDTARYVGINTCKLCHQDIYNSFIKTGMGKSFDVANKEKSYAQFNSHSVVYDTSSNLYYH